jgi:hypothetical protein
LNQIRLSVVKDPSNPTRTLMKIRILPFFAAASSLFLVSCDKPADGQDSKLSQLEKKAAQAEERQRQLESELAEQKLLTERDAIERERTLIEQDRMAMEEARNADKASLEAELEKRRVELAERERRISEVQGNLDEKERQLTGLEGKLSRRELDLAGRQPLKALPATRRDFVSGPTGDFRNFYEPLGAYGSWFNTRNFGYVYQPTVVRDVSWRPYTRGRWAFTDQGWTWVSSEPFGWACYHYGRWAQLRGVGWVWVPGSEWAPAWVTWRESPGHVGWAPLPPETLAWRGRAWDSSVEVSFGISSSNFSFVSYRNFGNNIQAYCLPPVQNTVIYSSTTNITHYQITGSRVFVGGPGYRNVCDRIGRPFPIHHLRADLNPDFGRGGRRLGSHFQGDELQVVAPRMDASWNQALRPANVNRDLGAVTIDRPRELSADVRDEFRDRRAREIRQAEQVVMDAGGRENFERERLEQLGRSRREAVEAEKAAEAERNHLPEPQPEAVPGTIPEQPQDQPVAEIPDRPTIQQDRPDRPGRPDGRDRIPTLPEPPAIPGENQDPVAEIPVLPNPTPDPERPERPSRPERPQRPDPTLPPAVDPEPEVPAIPPVAEPPAQPPSVPEQPVAPEMPERRVQPEVPVTPEPPVAPEPLLPEQPQQPEPTPEPARPDMPERDHAEEASRQQEEQERARQQEERMRQQQEEQERARQQQEQQRQQQEQQRQQQEQQQ